MAMAAIAWPVFLHFWNDRQGRVLRIGSVALLERSSPRRSWSRRLSEWLLLLLRCLLLVLLALLLAGPSWKKTATSSGIKGWLLTTPIDSSDIRRLYSPLIDSLSKAGYERHDFTTNGSSTDPDGAFNLDNEGAANTGNLRSEWGAFRSADREAPAGMTFVIITPALANLFHGARPISDRTVRWLTYIPQDSTRHWIASAWLSSPDSLRITEGLSDPGGTWFQYHELAVRPGTDGDFRIGLTEGRLSVAMDSQPPVIVDTAALHIAVYADPDRRQDSRYIAAAIRACGLFVKKRMRVDVTAAGAAANPAPSTDWLFWLSSRPVPGTTALHILQYEPGHPVAIDTWMQGVGGVKITQYVSDNIAATSSDTISAKFTPIWQDGFGHPLLNEENIAGRSVYHFYSRFDPAWSGLVWSPRFPTLLGDLLFHSDATTTGTASHAPADSNDRRVLDPEQALPIKGPFQPDSDHRAAITIDLAPAMGIFLLLLFIAERIISFRSSPWSNYGRAVGTK